MGIGVKTENYKVLGKASRHAQLEKTQNLKGKPYRLSIASKYKKAF